jgi:hypothetical protein
MMFSFNGLIAGVVGGAIAVAFAKLLPAVARRLKLLPAWIEGRTGYDIPDSLVKAFDAAIDAGVVAANSTFNRNFWRTVVNLLRKGKSEDAIQAFLEALASVDWTKPIADQIPAEWRSEWNTIREDVAITVARAEVAPHIAVTGNAQLAATVAHDETMRETVRASVVADKHVYTGERCGAQDAAETKRTIEDLIAESKLRQAKLAGVIK